jgi:hypothetical protein
MLEEWKKKEPRITPDDSWHYYITEDVIKYTVKILLHYGQRRPPSEGLVYWAGIIKDDNVYVSACIAPHVKASRYNIAIDHYSNLRVVQALTENKIIHIGQVHSHPFDWVGHSETDDECAAFKVRGLLSFVVPNFASTGMMPLNQCGVHRFHDGAFHMLSNNYISERFTIITDSPSQLIDLRNEKRKIH